MPKPNRNSNRNSNNFAQDLDDGDYPVSAKPQKSKKPHVQPNNNLKLIEIYPKTANQEKVFEHYDNELNLFTYGTAGTGKSFVAVYLALGDILEGKFYKRLVIVRSAVQGRDVGHLPGSLKEKAAAYEAPYVSICSELFGRSDSYEILKQKGVIEFITTSFTRGISLNDTVVIVDECQNMTFQELHTIITRIGNNSRIIFCGDIRQCDLDKRKEFSGFAKFLDVLKTMPSVATVEYTRDDICRSDLVKEYIIALENSIQFLKIFIDNPVKNCYKFVSSPDLSF